MSSQSSVSLVRSISASGRFVRKQLWIWPLVMALVLGVVGVWVRNTVEHAMKAKLAAELKTILDADVTALRIWLKGQQSNCVALAVDEHVRTAIQRLAEIAAENDASVEKLVQSSELADLRNQLKPWLEVHGYHGFVVIGTGHRIIGAMRNDPIGLKPSDEQRAFLDKALGVPTVSRPFKSQVGWALPTNRSRGRSMAEMVGNAHPTLLVRQQSGIMLLSRSNVNSPPPRTASAHGCNQNKTRTLDARGDRPDVSACGRA